MPAELASQVHFGGPGCAPGRLRDLLAERLAAVPSGGAVDFVTYYFRDRRLAAELLRARRRGVDVRVTLDAHPRSARANEAVIGMLSGPGGLGSGLRAVRGAFDAKPWGKLLRPRVHEKLYCFSDPQPSAFIGSFNPSGDQPEEHPEVIREIGDQDRGHNLLVELRSPALLTGLRDHARRLHAGRHGPFDRFHPAANRALRVGELEVHFWPRASRDPVIGLLRGLAAGSRVRIVASHLSGPSSMRTLLDLSRRGLQLEILVGGTRRRVPPQGRRRLAQAGISIEAVLHPDGLPMHDKFVLVDGGPTRCAIFGSFNWTEPSRRLNREIAAISRDPELFDVFASRWELLRDLAHESGRPERYALESGRRGGRCAR